MESSCKHKNHPYGVVFVFGGDNRARTYDLSDVNRTL